jgi:hypothetical protein|tara:strand:+ start:11976 stop:12428 length:453 start_codon:yes stop_codon:yes gene_type:complete
MNFKPDIKIDSQVWITHLQFVLQTISIMYPLHPNDVTKKKYYDTVHNLPLFFPHDPIGDNFSKLLDEFPMSPYLGSRESFMKWVHFIINKINLKLGWEQHNFYDSLENYYNKYKPKELLNKELYKKRKQYIMIGAVIFLVLLCFYMLKRH